MNFFHYKRGRATGQHADGTLRSSRFLLRRFAHLAAGAAIVTIFLIATSCGRPAEAQGLDADGSPPERAADAERRIPVRIATTALTDFVDYGEYVGEARGVSEVRLTADAGGRVTALLAEEGDLVGRGASLAEVDPELARATFETAVLNERITRETYEREQRFLQQGNSFQLRVDEAHLSWLQARSSLLDAEKTHEGAFAITPIDGTVLNRHIELYQDLEEGDPTFDVADLSRIMISVGVPEADIAGVRELEEAEITFAAFPERVFRGTPTSFARGRSDRTLSYEVDIEVDNSEGLIVSGQTARVRLVLRRHRDVVAVPSSVVVTRNDGTFVMVVVDGIAREVPVRTGAVGIEQTVILDGLEAGEQLVVEGFNRIADGTPVEIVG